MELVVNIMRIGAIIFFIAWAIFFLRIAIRAFKVVFKLKKEKNTKFMSKDFLITNEMFAAVFFLVIALSVVPVLLDYIYNRIE